LLTKCITCLTAIVLYLECNLLVAVTAQAQSGVVVEAFPILPNGANPKEVDAVWVDSHATHKRLTERLVD
jgi:hypothetical protein